MIRLDDYPYAQIREALGTIFGRLAVVLAAVTLGSVLGCVTSSDSILESLWAGVVWMPVLLLFSCIMSYGIFVMPILVLFTIAFVRLELPLWLAFTCTPLMWWNIHHMGHFH